MSILFKFSEWKHEHYFSADTKGSVFLRDLGFPDEVPDESPNEYSAIPYSALMNVLKELKKYLHPKNKHVVIDYGCGKGRALLIAGSYPFKKVIGIELCPELSSVAQKNLTVSSSRLVCKNIEVLTKNATEFQLPQDSTVLHFYNPFQTNVLKKVIENVRKSLENFPRELLILYANPFPFERLLKKNTLIPKEWVKDVQTICWPYFAPRNVYGNTYRIYRVSSLVE